MTKTTPTTTQESNCPSFWFVRLERGRDAGDSAQIRKAQERLRELGFTVELTERKEANASA